MLLQIPTKPAEFSGVALLMLLGGWCGSHTFCADAFEHTVVAPLNDPEGLSRVAQSVVRRGFSSDIPSVHPSHINCWARSFEEGVRGTSSIEIRGPGRLSNTGVPQANDVALFDGSEHANNGPCFANVDLALASTSFNDCSVGFCKMGL